MWSVTEVKEIVEYKIYNATSSIKINKSPSTQNETHISWCIWSTKVESYFFYKNSSSEKNILLCLLQDYSQGFLSHCLCVLFSEKNSLGTKSHSQNNPSWFQQNFSFVNSTGEEFYKTESFKSCKKEGRESLRCRYGHRGDGMQCVNLSCSQFKKHFCVSFIIYTVCYKVDETQ